VNETLIDWVFVNLTYTLFDPLLPLLIDPTRKRDLLPTLPAWVMHWQLRAAAPSG